MKFKDYLENLENSEIQDYEDRLSTLLYLAENYDALNENILVEDVNSWLSKAGLKLHKTKGLIDYVKDFSTATGKIFLASIKGDKDEVKRIAGTLNKADVVDFLLKLDTATLHLVTGPIHMIDSLLGWDLMADIKSVGKKADSLLQSFYASIKVVKDSIAKVISGKKQSNLLKMVTNIENNMPNA